MPIEELKRHINTRFRFLTSNSLYEMQNRYKDLIHKVFNSARNGQLTIGESKDGKKFEGLKVFRFGHRTDKIVYAPLQINEKNKKFLQEKYHLNDDFQILIILGFGHVRLEDEENFYKRMQKTAKLVENECLKINNIFANPFNNKTQDLAIDYIESGAINLKQTFDLDYLNNDEDYTIKK